MTKKLSTKQDVLFVRQTSFWKLTGNEAITSSQSHI